VTRPTRRLAHCWSALFLVAAATAALAASGAPAAGATAAVATVMAPSDSPAGFWYGTDSSWMPVTGKGPYSEPSIGGDYGGYIGMIGNWAHWQGCGDGYVWSVANSREANVNLGTYHLGVGTGAYWFMAGPGVDPHYDGTTTEARAWGAAQAARTLADLSAAHVTYPVVFADVELPGHAPGYTPAPDNGWNAVYTSPCSGRVKTAHIAPDVDRADLDGFLDYLTAHSSYAPGVYSAAAPWAQIFGTGSASTLSNVYEWTYESETSSLGNPPSAWCLTGTNTCAHFFGGIGSQSSYAVMWQWSGGGGIHNGVGDFDQIDANRTP